MATKKRKHDDQAPVDEQQIRDLEARRLVELAKSLAKDLKKGKIARVIIDYHRDRRKKFPFPRVPINIRLWQG